MDILLQTIISEFLIKAPKEPKNSLRLDLTTIEEVAAVFAIFATRRFGWPMATQTKGSMIVKMTSITAVSTTVSITVYFRLHLMLTLLCIVLQ